MLGTADQPEAPAAIGVDLGAISGWRVAKADGRKRATLRPLQNPAGGGRRRQRPDPAGSCPGDPDAADQFSIFEDGIAAADRDHAWPMRERCDLRVGRDVVVPDVGCVAEGRGGPEANFADVPRISERP